MRGSRCARHGLVVAFSEDNHDLCYACLADVRTAVEAEQEAIVTRLRTFVGESTPYEEHLTHDTQREWCALCRGVFGR